MRALASGLIAVGLLGAVPAAHAGDNGAFDISCQGGPGMTAQPAGGGTRFEIGFMIGEGMQPNPGECSFGVGGLPQNSRPILVLPAAAPNANLVVMATKGGTFNVKGISRNDGSFQVTAIMQVNVVDSTPLSPGEPAEGGGMAGGGEGGDPPFVASADCPAGMATVQTPEGLDFLNIRVLPSLDATVRAQAPDQSEVEVLGACLKEAAGLTKQKVKIPLHDWCRISSPAEGCVKREFLVFGDGFPPGAGLAKTKKKKH